MDKLGLFEDLLEFVKDDPKLLAGVQQLEREYKDSLSITPSYEDKLLYEFPDEQTTTITEHSGFNCDPPCGNCSCT